MRILHVTPFYYPVVGGVEEVVKHIAEYAASNSYEIYVVSYLPMSLKSKLWSAY